MNEKVKIFDSTGRVIKNETVVTGKKVKNPKEIIAQIATAFRDMSRKDISRWRSAIQLAEHPEKPRRDMLANILKDLETDGHLENQITLRKAAILNTEFHIINRKTGETDREKTEMITTKWFYDVLEHLTETPLYGHSLIELVYLEGDKPKFELIPRANVNPVQKYVIPDFKKVDEVIYYNTDEGWLLEFGKAKDLGIINKVVPNLIWKRNMMQSWAEFCEKFGIPMITASTNRYDDATLDLIEDMLSSLGEAAQAVFPEGTSVDIKEANRNDAYQVFDKKIERNNEEVSKAITGSTMLTDDGSSKSQSEVHERNLEERIAPMDRRSITFLVNDELIPLLRNRGLNFTDDDIFVFDITQEITLKEHWDIVNGILEKYEIDDIAWLSKTFNVPITRIRETSTDPPNSSGAGASQQAKTITGPIAMIGNATGINFPVYDGTPCCDGHNIFIPEASYNSNMDELHDELFSNFWNNKSTLPQESQIIALEGLRLLQALRSGWGERAVTVAYNEPDLLALSLMEFNLFEFSASKTEARLASMSQLLIDKDKLGIRSFSDFKREAYKVTEQFNTNWLRTEYNTSIAVGQNGSAFYQALAESDIIPYMQYLTAGDNRVRSTHQLLDKRIFNIKDGEAQRIWPPNEYGCRCSMNQYPYKPSKEQVSKGRKTIDDVLGGDEFRNGDFGINRGDTKQVFTRNQFYHSIGGLKDKVNSMNYKDTYDLKSYVRMKGLKNIKLDSTITPENVGDLFRIDGKSGKNDIMGFSDYLKRKIVMKRSTFDTHTTGKYVSKKESRHQMFPHIQPILNNPDEVWMHEYANGKFQARYIKFYDNMAFVINSELKGNNLEIMTWNQMKAKEKDVRKGILIKKRRS